MAILCRDNRDVGAHFATDFLEYVQALVVISFFFGGGLLIALW